MSDRFSKFVAQFPGVSALLPLSHTADGHVFSSIMTRPLLNRSHRSEYNEDLVFAYYGRPSYRVNPDAESNGLIALHPVCILFGPGTKAQVRRVVAFDSGACENGIFSNALHPTMAKEHFEVGEDISAISRLVECFYKNNENYLAQIGVLPNLPPTEMEAASYAALIANQTQAAYDDRARSLTHNRRIRMRAEASWAMAR